MAKPILYRPPSAKLLWGALGCTLVIYTGAVIAAIKREPPPINLADIPTAVIEASLEQPEDQPTPPPEDIPLPEPPPMPQEVPEFHEEATPPPKVTQRPKTQTPIKAPQSGISKPPGTMSISSAKANATYAPKPPYPYEARSRHLTGTGVCVLTVDASGSVSEATMAQSIGNSVLDNAATSTFRQWRFRPGSVSKVKVPITFTMTGASY